MKGDNRFPDHFQRLTGGDGDFVRLKTFDEVKLEHLALRPRPAPHGLLQLFEQVPLRRHLVGQLGPRIGDEGFGADHFIHDITRVQAELTQVTRVTTMGELTASIAHEICQPLGAIVNHSYVALRLLEGADGLALDLRRILTDIVRDAIRARCDVLLRAAG